MPIVSSSFPITTQKNWVANGDFATDITGWNAITSASSETYPRWHSNGGLIIYADGGTARMQQVVTGLTVGNKYLFQYECGQADEGNSFCHLGTTEGGVEYVANLGIGNEGHHRHVFTATATSLYIQLGATDGLVVTYRDVSLHDLGGDSTADMSTDAYTPSGDFPVLPPSITLDFANSRQLDPRITFSRASTATYLGRNGLLQTAKNNEPRFDHYRDGRCKGFLIEKGTTNLIPYSKDEGNWVANSAGTITTNSGIAPDGTNTASKISTSSTDLDVGPVTSSTSGGNSYLTGLTAGSTYTYSAYFKASTSAQVGNDFMIRMKRVSGDLVTVSETFTLESYWVRKSIVFTLPANVDRIWTYVGGVVGSEALVWGAQVELGNYQTSMIPTSGSAVTRAPDRAHIWGQNFSEWFNPTGEGTWLAKNHLEHQPTFRVGYNPWSPGNRYGSATTSVPYPSLYAANYRNALSISLYSNTGNVAYGNYNTVNAYSAHAPCDSNDEEIMYCVSYDTRNGYGKNMKVVCDHNDGTISTCQTPNYAADAGSSSSYRDLNTQYDTLALGGNLPWEGPWGNMSYNDLGRTWLMSLRYWPHKMTDSQMLSLTSNHTT